jgi:4-alpha-glucanotransferase
LKKYISEAGISLIGDIPLYVAYESADVWANQDIFSLTESGERVQVAGVPPDAFSDEGQLWGNPVYLWDEIEKDGFQWFRNRISKALSYYDYLRLDHFIGYVNYWTIPAGEVTAINGSWVKAMPDEFIASLVEQCGAEKFIAEDLGILTPEVCDYRDRYGFPGMIILQFCFDERVPDIASFPANKIIFSGTHDNQTTRGWFETYVVERPHVLSNLVQYLCQNGLIANEDELSTVSISSLFVKIAEGSPCEASIIPMQDLLGLADDARMNIPGTALGNWQWRMKGSFPIHNS